MPTMYTVSEMTLMLGVTSERLIIASCPLPWPSKRAVKLGLDVCAATERTIRWMARPNQARR